MQCNWLATLLCFQVAISSQLWVEMALLWLESDQSEAAVTDRCYAQLESVRQAGAPHTQMTNGKNLFLTPTGTGSKNATVATIRRVCIALW